VLDLSLNDFVNSTFDWINSLTSLVTLDLQYTEIKVSLLGVAVQNMSSLRNLHLSGNNFSYTIPKWLYNMTTLERLYLPENNIQGVLPKAIGCLSQLLLLDLSYNRLEGKIPRFLGNLCNLQHLDLSGNNLGGGLYELLGNSSSCTTKNLEFLDLSWNRLSGTLPDQLGRHKKLYVLSLSHNMLSGPIPVSLGYLSNLEELMISSNFLEGFVSKEHFSNLTKLRNLVASSNSLTLQVSTNWVPPFQLQTLGVGSWALGPRFPSWLQSQKDLRRLILSNASISDVIPSWFWSLCSQFYHIDFSQNQFRGNIPSLSCGKQIYLGSNNFSGPLPNVSSGIRYLDLSNNSFHGSLSPFVCEQKDKMRRNLFFLDLSKNLLYGELPNCWMNYSTLQVLNLGSNKLTGNIPSSLGSLSKLGFLLLSKNNLSGELPLSLQKCEYLMIVDLSENHLSGGLSIWLGNSSSRLVTIVLRLNRFDGSIPQELCHFKSLQIMDLAHNKLSGPIPQCFSNLTAMLRQIPDTYVDFYWRTIFLILKGAEYELYRKTFALVTSIDLSSNNLIGEIPEQLTSLHGLRFLNLSNNQLHGKIPEKINAMKLLESIDVSMNQLTGAIPQSMASLTFLSHLNLSYNNFSGRIPSSTQLQSFSAWSFIGNHDLCGPPLTPSCVGDDSPIEPTPNADHVEGDEDGGWIDMKWFYMSMPFGFVVGFWGVSFQQVFGWHEVKTLQWCLKE